MLTCIVVCGCVYDNKRTFEMTYNVFRVLDWKNESSFREMESMWDVILCADW
jgi:hypothetical protein